MSTNQNKKKIVNVIISINLTCSSKKKEENQFSSYYTKTLIQIPIPQIKIQKKI